jgi:ribonuclease PH
VDLAALGPRTLAIDCDVLEADGGTRTASITGAFVAVCDAVASIRDQLPADRRVIVRSIAAVSVGIVQGLPVVDLDYIEDSQAEVDLNVVMTGDGQFVEVQGTAEGRPFARELLDQQLALAMAGTAWLTEQQRHALGSEWPLDTLPVSC